MKRNSMTFVLAAWLPFVLLIAAGATGCGSGDDSDDDLSAVDGQSPYPNIHGGDVKGDKNFADLINKYGEAKGEKGWAAFWWPYTGNGIASGAYGGGGSMGTLSSMGGGRTALPANTTRLTATRLRRSNGKSKITVRAFRKCKVGGDIATAGAPRPHSSLSHAKA